jgi:hypothetical protein
MAAPGLNSVLRQRAAGLINAATSNWLWSARRTQALARKQVALLVSVLAVVNLDTES